MPAGSTCCRVASPGPSDARDGGGRRLPALRSRGRAALRGACRPRAGRRALGHADVDVAGARGRGSRRARARRRATWPQVASAAPKKRSGPSPRGPPGPARHSRRRSTWRAAGRARRPSSATMPSACAGERRRPAAWRADDGQAWSSVTLRSVPSAATATRRAAVGARPPATCRARRCRMRCRGSGRRQRRDDRERRDGVAAARPRHVQRASCRVAASSSAWRTWAASRPADPGDRGRARTATSGESRSHSQPADASTTAAISAPATRRGARRGAVSAHGRPAAAHQRRASTAPARSCPSALRA